MAKPFVVIATWNKWMVAVGISNIAERKGRPNLSGSSRQVRSQNGLNFGLLLVGLPRGRRKGDFLAATRARGPCGILKIGCLHRSDALLG